MTIVNNKGYKKNDKMNNLIIDKNNFIKYSKNKTIYMNGGIYFFKKNIFNHIKNKKISLENDILEHLILKKKLKVFIPKNILLIWGQLKT